MSIDIQSTSYKSDEEKTLEIWASSVKSRKSTIIDSLKISFFRTFFYFYPPFEVDKSTKPRNIKYEVINLALETCVIISLIIPSAVMKKDKDTFYYVWKYIEYLRLEKISGMLELFHVWAILMAAIMITTSIGVGLLLYKTVRVQSLRYRYARMLIVLPMEFMVSFCMPSIFSTFYILAKYGSHTAPVHVEEIEADLPYSSAYIPIFAAFLIIYFFLFSSLIRLMKTETRHDLFKYVPMARVNSRLDIMKSIYVNALLISYYFISESFPWVHIVVAMVGALMCWFLYFIQHPFYNPKINSIFANQFTILFMVSAARLVGYAQDDSNATFLISLLATPLVVILSHVVLRRQIVRIQTQLLNELFAIKKERECEFVLRKFIIDENPEITQIFAQLYDNQFLAKSKLIFIMDSYYTYSILENKPLARVKLSFANNCPSSFYLDYQEYKCRRLIESDNSTETLTYMKFASSMMRIKQKDQNLCRILDDIWTELSLKTPSAKKVRRRIIQCKDLITFVLSKYSKLIFKYPSQYYVYELLGTLHFNICNNTLNAMNYLQRAMQIKDEYTISNSNTLNLFHPNVGILIITCHPDYFGQVVFANPVMLEMLDYTNNSFIGYGLNDLIPDPFSKLHSELLRNFVMKRTTTEVGVHNSVLFLKDSKNYLIPAMCKMRIDAYGSYPCLIATATEYARDIHIAVLDEESVIQSHTKKFAKNFDTDFNLQGFNIFTICPILENKFFKPVALKNGRNIMLIHYEMRARVMNMVLVYRSLNDLLELELMKITEFMQMRSTSPEIIDSPILQELYKTKRMVKIADAPDVILIRKDTNSKGIRQSLTFDLDPDPASKSESKLEHASSLGTSNKSKSASFEQLNMNFMLNVRRSIKNLKLCAGLAVLGQIVVNLVILGYMVACVSASLKLGVLDSDMNNIKYYLQNINLYTRDLDLIQRAQQDIDTSDILTNIQQISDSISNILDDFDSYNEMLAMNSFYKEKMLQRNLVVWELNNGQQVMRDMNYIECLKKFMFSSDMIKNKNTKALNISDPDLYFLYQNSIGDMLKASDRNIEIFQDNQKAYVETIRKNLQFCMIGVAVVIILATGFIANRVYYVQISSSRVWKFIYSVSVYNLIELQRKSLDRLANVHLLDMEARINRIPKHAK